MLKKNKTSSNTFFQLSTFEIVCVMHSIGSLASVRLATLIGEKMEMLVKIQNKIFVERLFERLSSKDIKPGMSSCLLNIASCLLNEKISQNSLARLHRNGLRRELKFSLPKLLATVANLIAIGDGSGGGEEPGLQDQVHGLSQLLVRSPTHSPGLGR